MSFYDNPKNREGPLRHDIETYSPVDLNKCGVYVYARHPEFCILLFAFAYGAGPVEVIDLAMGEVIPPWLEDDIKDPGTIKVAYNANFERTCLSAHFHQYIPPDGWVCTMIQAAHLSLPLSLEKCGEALGTDTQKDKTGRQLIELFCKPHKKRGSDELVRTFPQDEPEKWEAFKVYNRIDVETERDIADTLKAYPLEGHELELYHMDQRINDRGILVDRVLVKEAIICDAVYADTLKERAYQLTGVANPRSVTQFKQYLEKREIEVDSLGKKNVEKLIAKLDAEGCDAEAIEALKLRLAISKSSVKKYQAAERYMCEDDRFRGGFQFCGAQRTCRWAGRGLQLQNLARNSISTLDMARMFLREGNLDALEMIYENVPDVLSQLVRTMFIPKPGCRFIVADYSAIEARALAWMSGEQWRLEAFRNGEDIYCASASKMFGVPVVKHGVNGELRQRGKIAELALGYGGSTGALEAMGALDKSYGLTKEELPELVKNWRNSNGCITKLWWDVDNAAEKALSTGREQLVANLAIGFFDNKLQIRLPSGRILYYLNPNHTMNQFGKLNLCYDGVQANKKFGPIATYGPKLVENIIQATCRDLLADAMLRIERAGFRIVAHVHDEVILEVPIGVSSVDEICQLMSVHPDWADDSLPLDAAGYECSYYQKD